MKDINLTEIQELTRKANNSENFGISQFPYLDSYKELNDAILKTATEGNNSISFDFVDDSEDPNSISKDIKKKNKRIYLRLDGGQAIYDVFDYPSYLSHRGFKVEIRKSMRSHGYTAKSYFISW